MARIAGTRDVVLGLWQARSVGDRRASSRATASVAACDAGDTLAFAALLRGGQRRPGLRGLAAALPATLIGAALAARLRRADP